MASVWYVGPAQVRSITGAQWSAAGITGSPADTVWNSANGWSIPASSLTAAQITLLDASGDFNTAAPDGPRTPGPASSSGKVDVYRGASTPSDRSALWLDTAVDPPEKRIYGSAGWSHETSAPSGLPSYAIYAHPKRYDPRLASYNMRPGNTRRLRVALALAQAGVAGRAGQEIVCAGDSKTFGVTAGRQLSWPNVLAKMLETQGNVIAGTGILYAGSIGSGVGDTRCSFTGTWSKFGPAYAWCQSNGGTFTAVSDRPASSVDIHFQNTSGAFSITVDGVAPSSGVTVVGGGSYSAGTVTPTGAQTIGTVTITGLAQTGHTVVVTRTTNPLYFVGVNFYNGSGLHIHNAAVSGVTANYLTADTPWPTSGLTVRQTIPAPAAVFLALGINDWIAAGGAGSSALAQFKTDMQASIDRWRALASVPDIILCCETPGGTIDETTWLSFLEVQYQLADSNDIPLIDFTDALGTNAWLVANGYIGADLLHETGLGHQAIAAVVSRCISQDNPTSPPTTPGRVFWTWQTPPDRVVSGSFNYNSDAAMIRGSYGGSYATGGPQFADWRWYTGTEPGTYQVTLNTDTGPGRGQVQMQISWDEGVTWTNIGALIDLYSASTVSNVQTTRTLTTTRRGPAQLRLYVPSKNASSTGYFCYIGSLQFSRIA